MAMRDGRFERRAIRETGDSRDGRFEGGCRRGEDGRSFDGWTDDSWPTGDGKITTVEMETGALAELCVDDSTR